eukprot:Filipodium_phascolosomae@DN1873_c0_g1_i2.p1
MILGVIVGPTLRVAYDWEPLHSHRCDVIEIAKAGYGTVSVCSQSKPSEGAELKDSQLKVFSSTDEVLLETVPRLLPNVPIVTNVACGDAHVLVCLSDGVLLGWGSNKFCQLGITTCGRAIVRNPCQILSPNCPLENNSCDFGYYVGKVHAAGNRSMAVVASRYQQNCSNHEIQDEDSLNSSLIQCGGSHD